jgi:hypothetical protein
MEAQLNEPKLFPPTHPSSLLVMLCFECKFGFCIYRLISMRRLINVSMKYVIFVVGHVWGKVLPANSHESG